jgi:hypothetical protein
LKDREYDSDDELKRKMVTYDERLTFINKFDAKHFQTSDQVSPVKNKDTGLPIVLHEREIME